MVTFKGSSSGGSSSPLYNVTCARCDAPREMPKPDRPRLPAINTDGSTTLDSDTACDAPAPKGGLCGSMRVRVTLTL